MPLRELLPLQQGQNGVREIEQADQVGDRGAAAADPPGELLLRDAEVVDQRGAGSRLLDRIEVLPDHVLDQRGLEALVLGGGPDDRGHAVDAGLLGGPPAALAATASPLRRARSARHRAASRSAAEAARPSRSTRPARPGRWRRTWRGAGRGWARSG